MQQEILDHNERVKNIIPPEKLLVFDVREGGDRVVEFLGVYVHYFRFQNLVGPFA